MRRELVSLACTKGLSQRRGCRLLKVARSMLGYESKQGPKNEALVARIRELALQHPRYGYRRIWALLRRGGTVVNHKRVHRLWKLHQLMLSRKKKRKRRGPPGPRPLVATGPNQVWAYDESPRPL